MSRKHLICEFDGRKIEGFPITLPCGYTICSNHLINESKIKDISYYESLITDSKLVKCFFCKNHQFNVEECFALPKNNVLIKEKIFKIMKKDFFQKLKQHISTENDALIFIRQSYKEIIKQVDLRRDLIKKEIDNYYEHLIQEIYKFQQMSEEAVRNKLDKINLKRKEADDLKLDEKLSKDLNIKYKSSLIEQRIQIIQDMLNKFNDLDGFLNNIKLNKFKSNNFDNELKDIFGSLEINQEILSYLKGSDRNEIKNDSGKENDSSQDFLYNKNFKCIKIIEGHSDRIRKLITLHTGELVSCSKDATIKVWDKKSGKCLKILNGHKSEIMCLLVLRTGELVSGSDHDTMRIWDLKRDICLKKIYIDSCVYSLEELPSGDIACGLSNGEIQFWYVYNQKCLKILKGHKNIVWSLKLLKTNELVSSSFDKSIKLWNIENGTCIRTFMGHHGSVYCVREFNSHLISGSSDGTIRIWNIGSDESIRTLGGCNGAIECLEIFDDGEIISGSSDGTVQFWNFNETEHKKTIEVHSNWVSCIKILPTKELITCSWDKTIKIWAVKTNK